MWLFSPGSKPAAYKCRFSIPALLPAVAWCLWLQLPVTDPRDGDWLWLSDGECLHCLQLSQGHSNPPGSPRTQLILPLPPSFFIPSSFCHHSAFTFGLWCNKEALPQNLQKQFRNEVSIKEMRVLAPEVKPWLTENPVHCQVTTKPGLMSSAH